MTDRMSARGYNLHPSTYNSRGRSQSTVTAPGQNVPRKVWLAQSGPCAPLWTNHCDWPDPAQSLPMLVRPRAFTSYWKGFLCRKLSSTVVSTLLWPTVIFRPYLCWHGLPLLLLQTLRLPLGIPHSPGFPLNRSFLSQSLCLASLISLTSSWCRLKAQALTSLSIVSIVYIPLVISFCLVTLNAICLLWTLSLYLTTIQSWAQESSSTWVTNRHLK